MVENLQYLKNKIIEKDNFVFYSKDRENKDIFINLLLENKTYNFALILCPKLNNEYYKNKFGNKLYIVNLEDFTKKNVLLNVLGMINKETLVIFENVSRYTILSSQKFNSFHRIRMKTRMRYLIDIVPFTKDITKLYLPLSYIERDIIKYSNGHAFKYNHGEIDSNGNIVLAHDYKFLSEKMKEWVYIDYKNFLPINLNIVYSEINDNESSDYVKRKDELFNMYANPKKIVTEICDFANMVNSRKDSLIDTIKNITGEVIIFTNIVKNNPPIKKYLKENNIDCKNIEFKTYYQHDNKKINYNNVIFFETPINNRYVMLDVISCLNDNVNIYYFRNNAKADLYIYDLMYKELCDVNNFVKTLSEVLNESISK